MNIAVYGGSFNPPHISHAMVASWCLWTGMVDQVWMVPVFRHAFEDSHGKKLAPYGMRLDWCQSFTQDVHSDIIVSNVESLLPTPNYTIDTLRHLQLHHPDNTYRLLIGSDVLEQIHEWKDWESIMNDFNPIIVGRVGYKNPESTVAFPGISSTSIRRLLSSGVLPLESLTQRVRSMLAQQNPYEI